MPSTCRSGLVEDHAERSSSRIIRPACEIDPNARSGNTHQITEPKSLRNALKSRPQGSAVLSSSLALEGVRPSGQGFVSPLTIKQEHEQPGLPFTTPAKMPSTCRSGLVEDHAERSSSRIIRPASRSIRGCAVRQHPPDHRPDESQSLRNALKSLLRSHCQCSSLLGSANLSSACARRGAEPGHPDRVSRSSVWTVSPLTIKQEHEQPGLPLQPQQKCHRRVDPVSLKITPSDLRAGS